ncbi:hypothetical protein ACHQM5_009677 [Ranunculus cassubicifolius]
MASETSKLEMESEAKCSPHKYYEMIKYSLQHLTVIFPDSYKSCTILEGDGKSAGTIRNWTYVLPGSTKVMECKEKTEVVDDENMVIILDLYEGCHKDHYSCFKVTMQVVPKGEETLVKWTIEFDKHSEGGPEAHHYMELFAQVTEKIDAHLLAEA